MSLLHEIQIAQRNAGEAAVIRHLSLTCPQLLARRVPTVYLSGPMTGLPDLNFPAFHEAARELRAKGFEVINPAEINPDAGMKWEACMRIDIKALCDCDAIALMPGWERSKGAHLELHIAHRLGLMVAYTDRPETIDALELPA